MTQPANFSVPLSGPVTPAVMAQRMDDSFIALMTMFRGPSKPSYLTEGLWLDDSAGAAAWVMKYYDGSEHITIGTINTTANTFTPAGGLLNNLSATSPPATSNDGTQGYAIGSMWVNVTTDQSYICLDATTGSAVWKNTSLQLSDLGDLAVLDTVENSNMATMAANTLKGNVTGSTAAPQDFSVASSRLIGRAATGNITGLTLGTGLILSGTAVAVDVGTSASKIVQLDGSARLPAVDGSQLTNLQSLPPVSSYTLSGTTYAITVDFATYREYVIVFAGATNSGGLQNYLEVSANGGSSYSNLVTLGLNGTGYGSFHLVQNSSGAPIFVKNTNGVSSSVTSVTPGGNVNRLRLNGQSQAWSGTVYVHPVVRR